MLSRYSRPRPLPGLRAPLILLAALALSQAQIAVSEARPRARDNSPPSVSWTSPGADATIAGLLWEATNSGASGPCVASATDDRAVARVDFYVDSSLINSDTAAPYNCKLDTTTVANGSHTLKAVAHDTATKTATSVRTVTVNNAPSVSWKTPAANQTIAGSLFDAASSGPSGPCEALASDSGGVSKVVFYVDGSWLNTESFAPYNCRFDTTKVANGSHTLKAVAYDASGVTATSLRTVNVDNAPPPPPPPAPPPPPPEPTLVFEENFDGTALNPEHWNPYVSPGHAGNGLRRASAFSVSDGLLAVTASWDGTNIVSGGMNHRTDYTYGSFEFRVRTEPDPSGQLSGVVLTWPQSGKWVPDGEIDIYETGTSTSRNPFYSFIHRSQDGLTDSKVKFTHAADATQWHVMRADWTATSLKLYRDGVLTHTLSDPARIPNVAHHMSIQVDAFSNRPLPGPVKMYVDWVKIYQ